MGHIKLSSLINLKEKLVNEPAHFDSGENLEVFGYDTKHFDICGSATKLYQMLNDERGPDVQQQISKSAKLLDKLFEIEKEVVRDGKTEPDQGSEAASILIEYSFVTGQISMKINKDLIPHIGFLIDHMEVIMEKR